MLILFDDLPTGGLVVIRRFLVAPALMLCSAPAFADDSNFVRCDGYGAPNRKADGMTKAVWLWGLAAGTADLRKSNDIPLGESGLEGCDAAMTDTRLLPAFWMRRAHLIQSKALHAIAASKPQMAITLLAESDAIGLANAAPKFASSIGLSNRAIRAYALTDLGRKDEALREVQAIVTARPWSSSIRRLAMALELRADTRLSRHFSAMKENLPLSPEHAMQIFWLHFLGGAYAEATAIAPAISFDLPKLRGGWSITSEENHRFEAIETRANINGARAYAAAVNGDTPASLALIEEARADIAEASVLPQAGLDGKPPKRSAIDDYYKRLPFVEKARTSVNAWEEAIAFRKTISLQSADDAYQAYETSGLSKLPILPDVLSQLRVATQAEIAARSAALVRYRDEIESERIKNVAFSLSDLARQLLRPETLEMTPVLKPAGDGYFLSDSGLSRAREGASSIWTIRYAHRVAPIASVEELALLGAAQTAIKQGCDSFIVMSRRSFTRTTHVTNTFYGVPMSSTVVNSGYEAQVRVAFVNAAALPVEFKGMEWRVLRAADIVSDLSSRYRQSKGITVAF